MSPSPPHALRTISIADRIGRSFRASAHTEGYARWKSGCVSIERESPDKVVASVRGKTTGQVELEARDERRILARCSCRGTFGPEPGCAHVWATVLELDHRGALAGLRGDRRALVLGLLDPPPAPPAAPARQEERQDKRKRPGPTRTTSRAAPSKRAKPTDEKTEKKKRARR